jgi:hypothetical protein
MIDFEFLEEKRWKYFAMDFLQTLGFNIECSSEDWENSQKDFLAVEPMSLRSGTSALKWLVSHKHRNQSEKVVEQADEFHLLERMQQLNVDRFIGIYSTGPSKELNNWFINLKKTEKIKDYKIFDAKFIEQSLLQRHNSDLFIEYFPHSYPEVKPIQLLTSEYLPILCDKCGKDLLKEMFETKQASLLAYVTKINDKTNISTIHNIYCACKTPKCDDALKKQYEAQGFFTSWNDLSNFTIPTYYLQTVFGLANGIQSGDVKYTTHAYEKYKKILVALAQKVLREDNETDQRKYQELVTIESIFSDSI